MSSEQMTVVCASSDLPHKIKNSKRNERATGNKWKGSTDTAVDRHAAPNDQHPQRNREKHVARASDSRNRERLWLFPMLCPRCHYERQPMGRDGSVQERDDKTRNNEDD